MRESRLAKISCSKKSSQVQSTSEIRYLSATSSLLIQNTTCSPGWADVDLALISKSFCNIRITSTSRGVPGLGGARARIKFGGPMFDPEVFLKEIYYIGESSLLVTLLGLSGAPNIDLAPGELFPPCTPRYAPVPWSRVFQVEKWFRGNVTNINWRAAVVSL